MRDFCNIARKMCRLTLLVMLSLVSLSLFAFTPSQEQIDRFKSLPEAEKRRLLKAVGIGDDYSSSTEVPNVLDSNSLVPSTSLDSGDDNSLLQGLDGAGSQSPTQLLNHILQQLKSNKYYGPQESEYDQDGEVELKPYGYKIFSQHMRKFIPSPNIPVPFNYVLGPGDEIIVQLFGKESNIYKIKVDRDGMVQFPRVGPISVHGITFEELKERINRLVAEKMIGVQASTTMGMLRSMQVFVLGDVEYPGAYTISALSTITNALLVSQGISSIGSLRNIQLKRKGELIQAFDFYKVLLNGDTSEDVRLLPGDVIFVPAVKKRVGIKGAIKRPALYELISERTVDDLIQLSGGLLPTAYRRLVRIERLTKSGDRQIINLNLDRIEDRSKVVLNGDIVEVLAATEQVDYSVFLDGHVKRPGGYKWKAKMRFSDIVGGVDVLKPRPDLNYALIQREKGSARELQILKVNIKKALENPNSEDDIILLNRDRLIIFSLQTISEAIDREKARDLLEEEREKSGAETVVEEGAGFGFRNKSFKQPGKISSIDRFDSMNVIDSNMMQNKKESHYPGSYLSNYLLSDNQSMTSDKQNMIYEKILKPASQLRHDGNITNEKEFVLENWTRAGLGNLIREIKNLAQLDEHFPTAKVYGSVNIPGEYPIYEAMDLKGFLAGALGFLPSADKNYMVLRRFENDADSTNPYVQVRILQYSQDKNILIKPGDELFVFSINAKRADILSSTVSMIKEWGNSKNFAEIYSIQGPVRFPGEYPLSYLDNNISLAQAIKFAGGLKEDGYNMKVTVVRSQIESDESKSYKKFLIESSELDSFFIQPGDFLKVKRKPNWHLAEQVTLQGEVLFPGTYTLIHPNETLKSVLERAGGLTKYASVNSAVFTREEIKKREEQRLEDLKQRMQASLAAGAVESVNQGDSLVETDLNKMDQLISKLNKVEPMGRMVIDLNAVLNEGMGDFSLQGGDVLLVPKHKSGITVLGEVQYASTHLYNKKLSMKDYIKHCGGVTARADKERIFLVRSNGAVETMQKSWFGRKQKLNPGDTIVVPLNIDRIKPMKFWTDVTQILYQTAVAVAAVGSL